MKRLEEFYRQHKREWLVPMIAALIIVGLAAVVLVMKGGTTPFAYSLF